MCYYCQGCYGSIRNEKSFRKRVSEKLPYVSPDLIEAAIRHLHQQGRTRKGLLAAALGISLQTAHRALAYMTAKGITVHESRWYRLRIVPESCHTYGTKGTKSGQEPDSCHNRATTNALIPTEESASLGSHAPELGDRNLPLAGKDGCNPWLESTLQAAPLEAGGRQVEIGLAAYQLDLRLMIGIFKKIIATRKSNNQKYGLQARDGKITRGYAHSQQKEWRYLLPWIAELVGVLESGVLNYEVMREAQLQLERELPGWRILAVVPEDGPVTAEECESEYRRWKKEYGQDDDVWDVRLRRLASKTIFPYRSAA